MPYGFVKKKFVLFCIYIHLAMKCSLHLFWIEPIYVNVDVIVLVTNVFCCFCIISTLIKRILSYLGEGGATEPVQR